MKEGERNYAGNEGNMAEWQRGMNRSDLPTEGKLSLAKMNLESQKGAGPERIREMGMPGYKTFRFSVAQFLESKEEYLRNIGADRVYVRLIPKKPGPQRYVDGGLTHLEAITFIQDKLSAMKGQEENYEISISPFFEREYAGSIIINPDGRLCIEFKKGGHAAIAHGKEVPEFSVERNSFLPSLRYSFADPSLRSLIYRTLMSIPHTGEGAHIEFTPGYYEFELIRENEDGPLEPKFFEYQNNPAFYLK